MVTALGEKGKKMSRLIDADALLMDNTWAFYDRFGNRTSAGLAIEEAPTVNAEPVRHGRWQKKRNPMMYQIVPYVFVCDQCGTAFEYDTPYCGECGAKMDESNEQLDERREDGKVL